MPQKEITERCQQAVEKASIHDVKLRGINKLANSICFWCTTKKQAKQLRAIDKEPSSKMKHRSIVIHLKNSHIANKCITNGCYINYLYYLPRRYTPQFQITQCYNYCEYGHRDTNCKGKPSCRKCTGNHNTKECSSTIVQCVHCKDSHEAWCHKCPAWTTEKHRLEELQDRCPDLFAV